MITCVTGAYGSSGELSRRDARLAVVATPVTAVGWLLASIVLPAWPWRLLGGGLFFLGLWLTARASRRSDRRGARRLPQRLRDLAAAAGWSTAVVTTVFSGSLLAVSIGMVVLVQRLFTA